MKRPMNSDPAPDTRALSATVRVGVVATLGLAAAALVAACSAETSGAGQQAANTPLTPSAGATSSAATSAGAATVTTTSSAPTLGATSSAPTVIQTVTVTPPASPSGPTPSGPTPSRPTPGWPAVPAGFVGSWIGHGRLMTIKSDGSLRLEFRTYVPCSATVTTGCDSTVGNDIHVGGLATGHVAAVANATTVTVMITSSSVPRAVPLGAIRLGDDVTHDALALFAGQLSGDPFCGPSAPTGYCGA